MSLAVVKEEYTELIFCDHSLQSTSDHHGTDIKQEEAVSSSDVCVELAENHPPVECEANDHYHSVMKDIVIKIEPIEMNQTSGLSCDSHESSESIPQVFTMDNNEDLICKLEEKTGVQNITEVLLMKHSNSDSVDEVKMNSSAVTPVSHSTVPPDKERKLKSMKKLMSYQLRLGNFKKFSNKKYIDGNVVLNFKCNKCAYETQVLSHFKNHYKSKHSSDLHPCDKCSVLLFSDGSLKDHLSRFHRTSKIFRCSKCDFSTDSHGSLVRHRLMKHSQKKHKCTECDRQYYTHNLLQSHIVSVHGALMPNSEVHSCHICHKVFTALSLLHRHHRTHTGIRPYACDKCDYKASQMFNLRLHSIRKHSNSKGFLCSRCNMNFTDQQSLDEHKQTRHANIKCPLCSFKSNTWKTLVDHHKVVHNSAVALQKPFQCSKCLAFFVRRDSLYRHNIKNESCSVVNPSKIRAERSCSKSRSSSIIDSQYSDEQKVNINGHVKLIAQKSMKHSVQGKDEKHHVCQACYEQFPSLKVLTRHLKYCVFR